MSKLILTIIFNLCILALRTQAAPATAAQSLKANKVISSLTQQQLPTNISTSVERYSLGAKFEGAVPIYSYQNVTTFDSLQEQIMLHFNYPSAADLQANNDSHRQNDLASDAIITQIYVYLEGNEGFQSQVYVADGGIGEHSIALEIYANNTNVLRYMIIIYGIKI